MFFRRSAWVFAAGLLGTAFVAEVAEAQGRSGRGGGPPFCSSGAGHPVHGWEWCVSKGWASARSSRAYSEPVRGWGSVYWDDVVFSPRRSPRYDRYLSRGEVLEVVGSKGVGRIESHARDLGLRGATTARWVEGDFAGAVLELLINSVPVAYLQGPAGPGRVERVYLRPDGRRR